MYFPSSAARQLSTAPALPVASEPVICLSPSPRKSLFCTLTKGGLSAWRVRVRRDLKHYNKSRDNRCYLAFGDASAPGTYVDFVGGAWGERVYELVAKWPEYCHPGRLGQCLHRTSFAEAKYAVDRMLVPRNSVSRVRPRRDTLPATTPCTERTAPFPSGARGGSPISIYKTPSRRGCATRRNASEVCAPRYPMWSPMTFVVVYYLTMHMLYSQPRIHQPYSAFHGLGCS